MADEDFDRYLRQGERLGLTGPDLIKYIESCQERQMHHNLKIKQIELEKSGSDQHSTDQLPETKVEQQEQSHAKHEDEVSPNRKFSLPYAPKIKLPMFDKDRDNI